MSKKKRAGRQRPPRLSPSQVESAETLPAAELALRRAEFEAQTAQRAAQQGIDLLREGAALLALSRADEAAARLEQAAALLPDDPDVAINLGGAYVLQGRYHRAVRVLERASETAPDNAMVWTNLAAAYLGSLELSGPQQQGQAITAYRRALQADPAAPNVHYNLGLIHTDRKEWSEARTCFTEALDVNPNDRDARRWLERLAQIEQAAAADVADASA